MKKMKVTMRDIAKELNLSVATVSYVLNHSEKEKISHETRLKVLETAKKMGYIPNLSARSLANKRSNLIGIMINLGQNATNSKKQRYYDLAAEIQMQLMQIGYDTVLSITHCISGEEMEIASKHSLEALFIIDMEECYLKEITHKCYVPIIFLECFITENIFYQILPDYSLVMQQAKSYLQEDNVFVMVDDLLNSRTLEIITKDINEKNIYINKSHASMKQFAQMHQNQKGIVIGEALGIEAERYFDHKQLVVLTEYDEYSKLSPTIKTLTISNKHKAKIAVDIMQQIMNLTYNEQNSTRILIEPKSS